MKTESFSLRDALLRDCFIHRVNVKSPENTFLSKDSDSIIYLLKCQSSYIRNKKGEKGGSTSENLLWISSDSNKSTILENVI